MFTILIIVFKNFFTTYILLAHAIDLKKTVESPAQQLALRS